MTETETEALLEAVREWRSALIPKTSTGTWTATKRLLDAVAAFDPPPADPEPEPEPSGQVNRILWHERGGNIDEIVIHHCTVHIEQMHDRCWWIGIDVEVDAEHGGYWAGNFQADGRGRMTFTEQEMDGFDWDRDDTHEMSPDA